MKLFPALLVILFITACKDNSSQPAADTPAADKAPAVTDTTAAYLPVIDLIREDIRRVDSFAGGILKKTTINGKKDSLFIKPAAFHQAAAAFLMPELEAATFRQQFTESSLADESTGQLQFIYAPKDPAIALRNVVAYITPSSSTSGDQVSRFYLEKEWAAGDTAVQQKLTWKIHQYFYVVTIRQPKKGAALTSIEKLIWDPEQFGE